MNDLILPLIEETDPFLREVPEEFDFKNPQMDSEKIERQLIANMNHYRGIGLSANQIGIPIRAFAFYSDATPIVAFNPKLLDFSEQSTYVREGCISFPGLYFAVERAQGISTYYQNASGEEFSGNFVDLTARIFQHEMEHMQGELFTDNANNFILKEAMRKRKIFLRKLNRKTKRR